MSRLDTTRYRIQLRYTGMFNNLNIVLNLYHRAEMHGHTIVPEWYWSPYSKEGENNVWNVFFNPLKKPEMDDAYFEYSSYLHDNVFAPRFYNSYHAPRLPPKNRKLGKKIIKAYFDTQIKKEITEKAKNVMPPKTIGLHIRGPLHISAGIEKFLTYLGKDNPPFDLYFQNVDKLLEENNHIFIATDSGMVRKAVIERYGSKVIHPDYELPEIEFTPHQYDKYEVGKNVLIEALLLSQTNVMVHGSSNLSNFVLCNNPDLNTIDIYGHIYGKLHRKNVW